MTIIHHPGEELILDYATGRLAEGWSLAIATHLALCPACRSIAAAAEEVAGTLLDSMSTENGDTPAAGPQQDWGALRQRIASTAADTSPSFRPESGARPVLPQPLRAYVGGDLDALKWRTLGRGAAQILIPSGATTTARLLRIPAGEPVPEHGHRGRELTLVLSGAFRDGDLVFSRGDLEDANTELIHQPIATTDADCVCLAVTDAPLRFKSWLMRVAQPLLGI